MQIGVAGDRRVVPVAMPDRHSVFDGDGRDQAVIRPSDGITAGAAGAVDIGGVEENVDRYRVADSRNIQEPLLQYHQARASGNALQNFLENGPANDEIQQTRSSG